MNILKFGHCENPKIQGRHRHCLLVSHFVKLWLQLSCCRGICRTM